MIFINVQSSLDSSGHFTKRKENLLFQESKNDYLEHDYWGFLGWGS